MDEGLHAPFAPRRTRRVAFAFIGAVVAAGAAIVVFAPENFSLADRAGFVVVCVHASLCVGS